MKGLEWNGVSISSGNKRLHAVSNSIDVQKVSSGFQGSLVERQAVRRPKHRWVKLSSRVMVTGI